jgi:uncharacterized membrane protein YdbT with pleckstrin-like domain
MNALGATYPSPKYLNKLYINVLLVFLIFVFPWILMGLIPELGWPYVVVFLVANALWIIPTFLLLPAYCRSIRYEIGDNELVVYKGILTKSVKTIPYRTITDLVIKRDILDRWLFGLGSLDVQTAGKSGQTGAEASLVGLANWDELHNDVLQRLRVYRISGGTGAEIEPTTTHGADTELLQQILIEIRGLRHDIRK